MASIGKKVQYQNNDKHSDNYAAQTMSTTGKTKTEPTHNTQVYKSHYVHRNCEEIGISRKSSKIHQTKNNKVNSVHCITDVTCTGNKQYLRHSPESKHARACYAGHIHSGKYKAVVCLSICLSRHRTAVQEQYFNQCSYVHFCPIVRRPI